MQVPSFAMVRPKCNHCRFGIFLGLRVDSEGRSPNHQIMHVELRTQQKKYANLLLSKQAATLQSAGLLFLLQLSAQPLAFRGVLDGPTTTSGGRVSDSVLCLCFLGLFRV